MKKSPYRNEAIVTMLAGIALLLFFIFRSLGFAQDPIGPVTRVTTNELQGISNQLPAVSVVSMSVVGQQGGALYYYWVVAKYGMNVVTQDQPAGNAAQSAPALITNAPSPLSGANYVRVCWNPLPNASGYDVLRTATDLLPNGAASIGVALNTAGNCVNDQGGALQSYTLTTYDPAKNPLSLKWGRMDMPKITPPPQNAPPGQCRLFVNRTTNSYDAVDETGATCFPVAAPGTLCTDLAQATNYYVSPTGSDTTGTGTAGNPWRNVQHAVDQIPVLVCGKYTIHLAAGTYPASGANAVHIDGRAFAGGGVGGWNAAVPPGGTYWPWESAWIEIVGDATPGDPAITGAPDDYIIDHAGACDGNAAISSSSANLVLRGLSVRNGGFGLLAHSSKVKIAGVTWQNNCTHVDAGYDSLIYFDKIDPNTGSWCAPGFCYYMETRSVPQAGDVVFNGNWSILLHDNSLLSDETADDSGTSTGSALHFTGTNPAVGSNTGLRMLVEHGARVNLMADMLWNTAAVRRQGRLKVDRGCYVFLGDTYYVDASGDTSGNSQGLEVYNGGVFDAVTTSLNNLTKGVIVSNGAIVINTPSFTAVGTPLTTLSTSYTHPL